MNSTVGEIDQTIAKVQQTLLARFDEHQLVVEKSHSDNNRSASGCESCKGGCQGSCRGTAHV